MDTVRLGIIGCGGMMRTHIRGVKFVENVRVTAFADIVLENAQALAEDYPGAYITTDYRTQIPKIIESVTSGQLSMDVIDNACRRVLTWKQSLGLLE